MTKGLKLPVSKKTIPALYIITICVSVSGRSKSQRTYCKLAFRSVLKVAFTISYFSGPKISILRGRVSKWAVNYFFSPNTCILKTMP